MLGGSTLYFIQGLPHQIGHIYYHFIGKKILGQTLRLKKMKSSWGPDLNSDGVEEWAPAREGPLWKMKPQFTQTKVVNQACLRTLWLRDQKALSLVRP